MDTNNEITLQK